MRFKPTPNSFINFTDFNINDNTFDYGNHSVGSIVQCHFFPDYGIDNTGGKLLPDGILSGKFYYYKTILNNSNKLFLTNQNAIDEVDEFVFTEENLEEFYRCILTTGIFTTQNLEMPCVERASADVEDMFCCPPAVELITTIPEYLTLDTGSEDDSGDYYLATYRVMYTIGPNLNQSNANLSYKSRNKPFEAIIRTQSNIYQGPVFYGTFQEGYTLAWEIYTDAEIVDGEATGNIRLKVLCTIWADTKDNTTVFDYSGFKTIQEYYSDWVDKDDFDYSGTCTIVDNADEDFMFPSVMGYYETPAGLPIPHSVDVSRSVLDFTMPETVQLYMPDAVFVTPEGNIELGNIDEVLNYNAALGSYYSDVKEHYLIQGRYFLPFSFYPTVLSENPTAPIRMGIGFGSGINSQISEVGGGLTYATITDDTIGKVPPLYFTNDIEERGPFVGSLSGAGAGYGGIFSGLDHGKPFIDSRAKVINNYGCSVDFTHTNNEVTVTILFSGSGYIIEPIVAFSSNANLIGVATLGEGEDEGKVISVTVTNPNNEEISYLGGIYISPPPPSYFDLSEKSFSMEIFFSMFTDYMKQPAEYSSSFFNKDNRAYYITSFNPDAFISSLDELDTPTIDEEI